MFIVFAFGILSCLCLMFMAAFMGAFGIKTFVVVVCVFNLLYFPVNQTFNNSI